MEEEKNKRRKTTEEIEEFTAQEIKEIIEDEDLDTIEKIKKNKIPKEQIQKKILKG